MRNILVVSMVGRSKKEGCSYIKKRIWSKLEEWKESLVYNELFQTPCESMQGNRTADANLSIFV